MKKVIEDLARTFGCSTHYSGGLRIMYVKGERAKEFIRAARDKHTTLAFNLQLTNELPEENILSPLQKALAPIVKELLNELPLTSEEKKGLIKANLDFPENTLLPAQEGQIERNGDTVRIVGAEGSFENFVKELPSDEYPIKDKVDAYLLSNPIDRTVKGCYNDAAKLFGVKSEYIRGRHRALREKNLIN